MDAETAKAAQLRPLDAGICVASAGRAEFTQDKAEEYAASPWQRGLPRDGSALLLLRSAAMQDENAIGSLPR